MFAASKTDGAVATTANYIEDVFSTYLYTGNGSTQTITNGIDLSGKGGMVWSKDRTQANNNVLQDTDRGVASVLSSNLANGNLGYTDNITAFNSTGYAIGAGSEVNRSSGPYVSWTFRKQAKFFDVVTYTGNGANRTISHNLGSTPGFIIVKRTDSADEWYCYHRSLAATELIYLNLNNGKATYTDMWNSTAPTSTVFSIGTYSGVNTNGGSYVAYLFAHDAGGFGLTGSDNVITCGSYTGNGSATGPTITLGYEPQWVMIKKSSAAGTNWEIIDSMRGFTVGSAGDSSLRANLTSAEVTATEYISPTATGFNVTTTAGAVNTNGDTYIYIAIRRGPMKTPTSGTSVFSPVARTGTGSAASITGVGFPPDLVMFGPRSRINNKYEVDRLRGASEGLVTNSTTAGVALGSLLTLNINGISFSDGNASWNQNAETYVTWFFGRAPGFFDVVCYTGTGSATTFSHNLTVVPELMIVKCRSTANDWAVYANNDNTDYLLLNSTAATADDNTYWNDTSPTASVFSVGTNADVNTNAATYVAYLFATVAGVSKVGTYTGNGSNQTINCGFAAGARFVLIKRTDSTGNWVTFDTARGIVSGNDPALYLNSTAAEVTGIDAIDPDNSGFIVNQETTFNLNVNAASYVFLAIS